MIYIVLYFLCIALASTCSAIIDTISYHYYTSIFTKYNKPEFWNPEVSWTTSYIKYTKYKPDAWHLFKSLMIVLMCLSGVIGIVVGAKLGVLMFYWYIGGFISSGLIWNVVFNILFNKILKR